MKGWILLQLYKGLNDIEALKMREKYGSNKLSDTKSETFFQKYFKSFDDPIITILLIALAINVIFTFFGKVDWFECVGILISVLISTFISTLSEYKNEKNFKTLSEEASRTFSKVYRNGQLSNISTDEIVYGDVVLLQPGDIIPADGIVTEGSIFVDQSCLNGENKEVEKYADDNCYNNTAIDFWNTSALYRGSIITRGECVMYVTSVGDKTVYGKLNAENESEQRESPLTLKLKGLAKSISKFGYIGALLTFLIIMLQKIGVDNAFDPIMIQSYFNDYTQFMSDFTEAAIMGIIVILKLLLIVEKVQNKCQDIIKIGKTKIYMI